MTTTTTPLLITEHWATPLRLTAAAADGERQIERAFAALTARGFFCSAVPDHDGIPCHGELELWAGKAGAMAQTLQDALRLAGIAAVIGSITERAPGGGDRVYAEADIFQVQ